MSAGASSPPEEPAEPTRPVPAEAPAEAPVLDLGALAFLMGLLVLAVLLMLTMTRR